MLTQCPACSTMFRVTGAILKMGHGQVRCGKCRTQFDALDSLIDEEEPASAPRESEKPAPAPESPPSPPQAQDFGQPFHQIFNQGVGEQITLEGSSVEISGTHLTIREPIVGAADEPANESPSEPPNAPRDEPSSESASSESVVDIDLSDFVDQDTPDAADDAILDEYHNETVDEAELAESVVENETPPGPIRAVERPPISQRIWRRHQTATKHDAEHKAIAAELAALTTDTIAPAAKHARLWTIAGIALVALLAAQATHHYRDDLVRHAKLGPTVTRIYHALGLTLTPRWDLGEYELQQWGVIADRAAPNALRVRAGITNRALFAQPYPLVKLVLEDRWGAPVAMRTFTPGEYLPERSAADRLLSPKQRANAEIVIADPGADAVGFKIHACLRYEQGLVCADE